MQWGQWRAEVQMLQQALTDATNTSAEDGQVCKAASKTKANAAIHWLSSQLFPVGDVAAV